ncbi:unnamed protein product [Orchesella dallaii]|uniref:C2H2-type domain-containing protein n=1 Tax=Orchesella dallaii TaxID=48710 RepID=A0ABP1PZV4_9HEXA
MAPDPPTLCLVCYGLTRNQAAKWNNEDDDDEKESVFQCFHKIFLIKKHNHNLWDVKEKGKGSHLSSRHFPFCKQCAQQILTIWELHKKLNELELSLREKLEKSESQFESGSAYQDDRRYYKIRREILGGKAKLRTSKRSCKPEVAVQLKENSSASAASSINLDNNERTSPSPPIEIKIEIYEEDLKDTIKSEATDTDNHNADEDGAFQFEFAFEKEAAADHFPVDEGMKIIIHSPSSPPTYDEGDNADADNELHSDLEQGQSLRPSKIIEKKKFSKRTKKNESSLNQLLEEEKYSAPHSDDSTSNIEEKTVSKTTKKNKTFMKSFWLWEEDKESCSERKLRKRKNLKKIIDEDPSELSAPESHEDNNSDPDFDLPSEEEEEDLMCFTCKKVLSRASSLEAHRRLYHPETPKVVHNCPTCGKPCLSRDHIKTHGWTHLSGEEKELAISRGEQPTSYQRRFQCELCPNRFKTPADLQRHQETVHVPIEERRELCPICGGSFANLQGHIERVHETTEEDKKHVCFVCEKRFLTLQALRFHRVVHDGKREWKCDLCPREFAQEVQLKKHKDSHLNIRRFQCQHCESAFTSNSNLKRHSEIYHAEGGSKAKRPRFIRGPAKRKYQKGGSGSGGEAKAQSQSDG